MVKGLKGLEDYNWPEMPKNKNRYRTKMNYLTT